MSHRRTTRISASLMAGLVAASLSCSDDPTGTTTGLTAAEKAAIVSALGQSGALAASPLAGFAFLVVEGLNELGTLDPATAASIATAADQGLRLGLAGPAGTSYEDAFGAAVGFDVTTGGERIVGSITGVVGWNGLNTSANTVDELVTALLIGIGSASPPSSGSATIESGLAFASYFDGTNAFFAETGNVVLSGSSFSGASGNCAEPVPGYTITCSYTAGTMTGNLGFSAQGETGTYDQSGVRYTSLPAVRVNVVITEN